MSEIVSWIAKKCLGELDETDKMMIEKFDKKNLSATEIARKLHIEVEKVRAVLSKNYNPSAGNCEKNLIDKNNCEDEDDQPNPYEVINADEENEDDDDCGDLDLQRIKGGAVCKIKISNDVFGTGFFAELDGRQGIMTNHRVLNKSNWQNASAIFRYADAEQFTIKFKPKNFFGQTRN
eukprot:TRINITY_DN617_c1_g1_i3.p1 TRINITY_DN617_c1_g1~~TRINITY_DN617_c1_g1_i3.p1  ORF type:complete len:178 (-),score=36.20 TRINITY_DN617_c1_g1_i3:686-1219(-)